MLSRNQQLLVLVLLTAGLSILFGTLHIVRFNDAMERQLADRASLYVTAFEEQTSIYLATNQTHHLDAFSEMIVRGGVLYAQVVVNNEIVAESSTADSMEAVPEVEAPSSKRVTHQKVMASGLAILDILQVLKTSEANGQANYVRLGVSLKDVQNDTNREILWVVIVGFSALGLVAVLGFFILWRIETTSEPTSFEANAGTMAQASLIDVLEVGEVFIDDKRKEVCVQDRAVQLTQKEYELLKFLASEKDKVFSHGEIREAVWPDGSVSADDVKKYIYFLRRKIEADPSTPSVILTVKGFGYRIAT